MRIRTSLASVLSLLYWKRHTPLIDASVLSVPLSLVHRLPPIYSLISSICRFGKQQSALYECVCVHFIEYPNRLEIHEPTKSVYASTNGSVRFGTSKQYCLIIRIVWNLAGVVMFGTQLIFRDVLKSDCIQLIGEFSVAFRVAHHSLIQHTHTHTHSPC